MNDKYETEIEVYSQFEEDYIPTKVCVEYEYFPATKGKRGANGEPIEPDEESMIDIKKITNLNNNSEVAWEDVYDILDLEVEIIESRES